MRLDRKPAAGRVLTGISHGGHVLADDSPEAARLAATHEGITALEAAVSEAEVVDNTTPFDYLFPELAAQFPGKHLPNDNPAAVVAALKALGGAMVEDPPPAADPLQPLANSTIPPVYTYWGQFIDHDITANTDRDSELSDITRPNLTPLQPAVVAEQLRNLRHPALNLDSVYGDGPTFDSQSPTEAADLYDGIKLKVGTAAAESNDPDSPIRGVRIPPDDDLERDLPRVDKKALIGDDRNDENLIIAQFHLAFLRFHNATVDWVQANEPDTYGGDAGVFDRARQLVRWQYQWLVVHDYLKTVTLSGVADKVLLGGNKHYEPRDGEVYMPLEFSVAGYRFGHSMVRAVYDYNRNFGRGANVAPNASFFLLFLFTGNNARPFGGDTDVLPFNWIIEWDRMVDKGARFPDQFARKIETRLAPPLRDLTNRGNDPSLPPEVRLILKRLATSNLLRGYLLAMPTGQAVAEAMGVPVLSSRELQQDNNPVVNDALRDGGFLDRTPLWYYLLKEAEVQANGNSLGELGSRLVCETLIGQLRADPDSYLNQEGGWSPELGLRLPNGDPIVTIGDFLRFATVLT
ncbi:MAG: heme peroxidase family protein [Actinomycetota bacterium]|nr:heme peroxidase family protein [Actinomycetota bacterium]